MLRFATSLQSDQECRLDQIFRDVIRVSIALASVWVATLLQQIVPKHRRQIFSLYYLWLAA